MYLWGAGVTGYEVGQRVLVGAITPCGQCHACLSGKLSQCGHGTGYDYPHSDPRGWVPQTYRPSDLEGRVYYQPSPHGFEEEIAERMRHNEVGDDPLDRP